MSEYSNPEVSISSLPQLEQLSFIPMDKAYPKIKLVETMIFWTVLSGVLVALIIIQSPQIPLWFYLSFAAVAIISCLLRYLSACCLGYCLREKDILYKKGLFWKKRTGVSFKRIQHIDLSHGPIERKFGLATIKFFTAGGAHVDLRINGLAKKDAENLRSHILTITGVSDV